MSSPDTLAVVRRGGSALIELRRPDALNAWNDALTRDLLGVLDEIAHDPEVRAVGLTGAGRAFCSGADLKAPDGVAAGDGLPDLGAALLRRYNPVILALRELPKPVVALVNGPAVGVGCSLALAADLIVAAESAYFLLAFVNIGLAPDGGASAFLPARVGLTRAVEMAMLGERIGAAQALDWGLVNRVVPDAELRSAGDALLDRIADGPTRAYAGMKRQFGAWAEADLRRHLQLEADVQRELGRSSDFSEGIVAFATRRAARFTGA